ncbi:MAG: lipocalin-like domain-containing protein [Bacteroidaceae bacterium]|nr:lipocalin-like domain-containing protein [Bacteroidaceae bacterium]
MNKIIPIFILSLLFVAVSCQKKDDNGNLGGFWKLLLIEPVNGDAIDTKEKQCFWKFQLNLMQVGGMYGTYGRFEHVGDSLFISLIDYDKQPLRQYGLYTNSERFGVEHLDRNGMVLQSDSARLTFRKF